MYAPHGAGLPWILPQSQSSPASQTRVLSLGGVLGAASAIPMVITFALTGLEIGVACLSLRIEAALTLQQPEAGTAVQP